MSGFVGVSVRISDSLIQKARRNGVIIQPSGTEVKAHGSLMCLMSLYCQTYCRISNTYIHVINIKNMLGAPWCGCRIGIGIQLPCIHFVALKRLSEAQAGVVNQSGHQNGSYK